MFFYRHITLPLPCLGLEMGFPFRFVALDSAGLFFSLDEAGFSTLDEMDFPVFIFYYDKLTGSFFGFDIRD